MTSHFSRSQTVIFLLAVVSKLLWEQKLAGGSTEMAKPGGYYILRSDIFFDDLRNKIWLPLWFQIISIRHILLVFCGLGPGDFLTSQSFGEKVIGFTFGANLSLDSTIWVQAKNAIWRGWVTNLLTLTSYTRDPKPNKGEPRV